jgi:hypothetical protein
MQTGTFSTSDYLAKRRQRAYELMKKHSLRVPWSELAMDDMLERAVIAELLDKLLDERKG